jgi:hypothetical protein
MNSLRCTNCSFLNFASATVCKRCGSQFEQAAAAPWESHPSAPAETGPQPTEVASHFWDQPAYQPSYALSPVPSDSSKGKVVGSIVAFAVVALIALIAVPKLLKLGKANFANVTWSEYKSPDKKFSVSLPGPPKEAILYQQTPLGRMPVTLVTAQLDNESGCMLMHADYPVGEARISEEAIYSYALNKQGPISKGVEMGARKYITHDGHKGLEIELKQSADGKSKAIGLARLFWVSPRIYVLISLGPDTAEFRAFQPKCHESFKLY